VADQIQDARWPGIPRVQSLSYTCVHGISPGEVRIVTYPQGDDVQPATFGTLFLTDGTRTVALRNCKADKVEASHTTDGGTVYTVVLLDRRWQWRNAYGGLGGISGRYNQLDPRGKLKPWSIRSPAELARLCLNAMGERNYLIDLPDGIPRAAGANLDRFLRLGERFPMSGTNPDVNWDHSSPAEVLAQLADRFNCRVVYQPVTDRVLIVPLGKGVFTLGTLPVEMAALSVDDPETPALIGVYGAPVRVQTRFALEPVAEEWDGSYVPIDAVSYAPKVRTAGKQKVTITYSGPAVPAYALYCKVHYETDQVYLGDDDPNPAATVADRWERMQAAWQADVRAAAFLSCSWFGNVFTVEAKDPGTTFTIDLFPKNVYGGPDPADLAGSYTQALAVKPAEPGRTWTSTPPPFAGVTPTDRLTYTTAVGLARKSVFRCFRVMNVDPHARTGPLTVPPFGRIRRLTQLVIQPTKVEQVVPTPRIAGGVNKGDLLPEEDLTGGILPEFYNGRSRDQAATVTGSCYKFTGGMQVWWAPAATLFGIDIPADLNSSPLDRVWIDFAVQQTDTGDTLVVFSDYVRCLDVVGGQNFQRRRPGVRDRGEPDLPRGPRPQVHHEARRHGPGSRRARGQPVRRRPASHLDARGRGDDADRGELRIRRPGEPVPGPAAGRTAPARQGDGRREREAGGPRGEVLHRFARSPGPLSLFT
jgi:hypothetical protein